MKHLLDIHFGTIFSNIFVSEEMGVAKPSLDFYKMAYDGEYNDENKQKTIVFNDKRFNVEWPVAQPILSKRDRNGN